MTLFDECTITGVIELEKYYSGGRVVINDSNCLDILSICLFYNEITLLKICEKYLINHINDSLVIKIINNSFYLNARYLSELKYITEEYLKFNSYKLFHYYILSQFSTDTIEYLLSNQNVYIGKENKLFELFYNYYQSNFYEIINDKKEESEIIKSIFSKINYNNIDLLLLSDKEREFIDQYSLNDDIEYENHNYIICINFSDKIQSEVIRIVVKYYQIIYNNDYDSILSIDRKDIIILKDIENKDEYIVELLSNTDLIVIIIILIIIIDINYDFDLSLYQTNILKMIIEKYQLHSHLDKTLIKCFTLFINNNESYIEEECGRIILLHLLNYYEYLSETQLYSLIKYIKKNTIMTKEEEEYVKENINNESIVYLLQSIYIYYYFKKIVKKLTYFTYNEDEISSIIYESMELIPNFDGDNCSFYINPELPDGLILDKSSGIIHGRCRNAVQKKEFEIRCENITNCIILKLKLHIEDVHFLTKYKHPNIIITSLRGKTIKHYHDWCAYHCYLNVKMVDGGIYHFKYKINEDGDFCGVIFGGSKDDKYEGVNLHEELSSCCYGIDSRGSWLWGGNGEKVGYFCKFRENEKETYELIFNLIDNTFLIKYKDESEIMLFKDIVGPLYPFVTDFRQNIVELIDYWKD